MANRPVFIVGSQDCLVKEVDTDFKWHPGFSLVQKRKNIKALHDSFKKNNKQMNILEISTKSKENLGVALSAFNLKTEESTSIECTFQASKVFIKGGPYKDILEKTSKEAKRDSRLRNSGELTHFEFKGSKWPLEPKTLFYDWLYLKALEKNQSKAKKLINYDAFTDIEFNPKKSFNCQARSAALFVSLQQKGLLKKALSSAQEYKETIINNTFNQQLKLFN